MHVTFNFRFPNRQKQKEPCEVLASVVVPAPAQRPKAVLNFLFMCTGELPSGAALDSCGVAPGELAALATGGELQTTGLKPFAESAVVRIERGVMMEIGSSTTKTIFGGFTADEPPLGTTTPHFSSSAAAAAAGMQQLRAGTLLLGNVGMANTNGSRYYILLHDVVSEAEREELRAYQPLGMVTAGLEALCEACASAAVQPRTLAPLQAVKMWVSEVRFPPPAPAAPRGRGEGRESVVAPRTAGRTRRREEVELEEQGEASAIGAEGGGGLTTAAHGGFFNPALSFPAASAERDEDRGGPQAKRRRTERYVTAADGTTALRTTAVAQAAGAPFDYFAAQEPAFLNDVEAIAAAQAARQHRRGKQQQQHQKRERPVGKGGLSQSLDTSKRTKGAPNASAAKKKKTLPRRY
ncbi:putative cyclophilin 15 [Trypanosoma conorhini]|uniref:Putative cyclophilin 15 n=1 Tax=Trypanosoma conorhini TaxID=83891 RepID=A0A3R7P073_9TRYP|nr:putative cyclophilin 15 [Trypanosoma conorhini]RNF26692.1 putative cyclophilin 15 [Trypanosoma conorhini]